MGHNCVIWGKGHENFTETPDFNQFDLVINLENYGDEWLPNLSQFTKPFKMIWCIDAHVRGVDPYENIFRSGRYDILAHATRDYVKDRHHIWLPNCTDSSLLFPMTNVQKTYRIGFCGNHVTPSRKQTIDILTQLFGLKQDIFVIGDEMVKAINSYHIHFNMNIANDINYRSFETLACGTVLLTNSNSQYDALGFMDGHNCFMYSDREDLIRKATELLSLIGDTSRILETVAEQGRDLLMKRHTYDCRAKEIVNVLSK